MKILFIDGVNKKVFRIGKESENIRIREYNGTFQVSINNGLWQNVLLQTEDGKIYSYVYIQVDQQFIINKYVILRNNLKEINVFYNGILISPNYYRYIANTLYIDWDLDIDDYITIQFR